ncbi:FH1/FH2 domain-containing protein 3 [Crenichthys baileyi]|uniref:FH1/FH2 domain-containing protein 3 n=1 Tax=Crenichthys baileyi TaxID=28760 RepID=A0AAV9QR45_9TELE
MATFVCRVQFLDDTDPFNSTNFPEPTRPPLYTFREDIPLINQLAGVHRLLKAPHKLDDCALQLSHNGTYLDLESSLAEQRDELEGFQVDDTGSRGKKHSVILRTQLTVRVHACIGSVRVKIILQPLTFQEYIFSQFIDPSLWWVLFVDVAGFSPGSGSADKHERLN